MSFVRSLGGSACISSGSIHNPVHAHHSRSRLMLPIQRWRGQAQGRSRAVAYQGMVWAVATSDDEAGDVQAHARRRPALLDETLAPPVTDHTRLLPPQVFPSH